MPPPSCQAYQAPISANLHPTIGLESETTFTQIFDRIDVETAQLLCAGIGSPQRAPHPAGARTTPTHAPPHVPFTQRRFTTPRSDQTPVPGSALQPHLRGASTDHVPLPPQGLPSGQTLVQELLQTPTPEQPAAVHSAPAAVSAPVRLPVQLFARRHVPVSAAPAPALC